MALTKSRGSKTTETHHRRDQVDGTPEHNTFSFIGILGGTLAAFGALFVLAGLAAATGFAVDPDTNRTFTDTEWRQLGMGAAAALTVALFLSFLLGGYVAGRMSRWSGLPNGFLVFVLGLLIIGAAAGLTEALADTGAIADEVREGTTVPTEQALWTDIGVGAAVAAILGMLLGSLLGGHLGSRWHERFDAFYASRRSTRTRDDVVDTRDDRTVVEDRDRDRDDRTVVDARDDRTDDDDGRRRYDRSDTTLVDDLRRDKDGERDATPATAGHEVDIRDRDNVTPTDTNPGTDDGVRSYADGQIVTDDEQAGRR